MKLFWLIHNERPYKRYYYQPLLKKYFGHDFFYELKLYATIFLKAAYLPFNAKYNVQQFEGERKSRLRMLYENLLWAFKYKEVCLYYFLYGLDIKGHNPKDYVAYTEFRVLRNILNFRQRENLRTNYTFNYLALTRDKFVFYQYCKSLSIPYPKLVAIVSRGKISWCDDNRIDFEDLDVIRMRNFEAFCKEINGELGKGAFVLKIADGEIYINSKKVALPELRDKIGNATFIIQERLSNHPLINKIYPTSLNTLRLVTFLNPDGIVEFYAANFKFGTNGNIVDNSGADGIFMKVDENGVLGDTGYYEPGHGKYLVLDGVHPETGLRFGGLKLPYWEQIINYAMRFHKFFYGIPSMGWDIAVTPTGPVFTECGEDWEIGTIQTVVGGQREHFYKTHGYALKIKLRKY